jgi:HEAT repeat protein
VPALIVSLDNPPDGSDEECDRIRQQALQLIGKIGPPAYAALPHLTRMMEDESPATRQEAALALWRVSREVERVEPILSKMLADANPNIHELARIAFLRIHREMEAKEDKGACRGATHVIRERL